MKNDALNELQTVWPVVGQARTRLLSSTFSIFSFFSKRRSESHLTSESNSTMQQCWPSCEPDLLIEHSKMQKHLPPCQHCFEPSSSGIIVDVVNSAHGRQSSEPVDVPDPSMSILANSPQHAPILSNSSGYESGLGNGLSPLINRWTLGVNDVSSCQTSTDDDLSNDQDRSEFDEQDTDDDTFEVLSFEAPPESSIYIKEFPHTTTDSQHNICACCNLSFSSVSNMPARRCYYFGKLYCSRCHTMDYAHIPAKILQSFDVHSYPVCRRAKSILQSCFYQPIFDIQNDNDNLYISNQILTEIKHLRSKFQHFYAYLSTCSIITNELQDKYFKEFYARDYLYQSVHLYSLNDLLSLKKILHSLHTASSTAKQHIFQCVTCCQKGFICEICKNRDDILYPFDSRNKIAKCNKCSNIYHKKCWDKIDHDCPKCYRLIQRKCRQDIP